MTRHQRADGASTDAVVEVIESQATVFYRSALLDHARGDAGHRAARRHVRYHNSSGADDGFFPTVIRLIMTAPVWTSGQFPQGDVASRYNAGIYLAARFKNRVMVDLHARVDHESDFYLGLVPDDGPCVYPDAGLYEGVLRSLPSGVWRR